MWGGGLSPDVQKLLGSCYERALQILKKEKYFLNALAEILLEIETLDSEEFEIIYECSLTKKGRSEDSAGQSDAECSACPVHGQCMTRVSGCPT